MNEKTGLPVLKLDANESPLPPPPWLREAIVAAASSLDVQKYPDKTYRALRAQIAATYELSADQITLGNGSGEVLLNLMLAAKRTLAYAIWPWPTFGLYRDLAQRVGLPFREATIGMRLDSDLSVMESLIGDEPVLCILTRPNNPTGSMWPEADILALYDRLPPQSWLVIDEAYAEFAGVNLLPWTRRYPNVIVVRTLSKAYGMAGLRVGFAAGPPALIHELEAIRLPYPIDRLSEHAAAAVLAQRTEHEASARRIQQWCAALAEALRALPNLEVVNGLTNFLMIRPWIDGSPLADSTALHERLRDQGILTRIYAQDDPNLAGWLRISACDPADIERVAAAVATALAELKREDA